MTVYTDIEIEMEDGEVFYGGADCAGVYVANAVDRMLRWHRKEGRAPTGYRLARGGEYGPWVKVEKEAAP